MKTISTILVIFLSPLLMIFSLGLTVGRIQREIDYGSYGVGAGVSPFGYRCPMCPYQQPTCDSGSDLILYFSAGTLLGLLLSMMQTGSGMQMAMTQSQPPQPTTMGKRIPWDLQDSVLSWWSKYNVSEIVKSVANDVIPLADELASIYSRSLEHSQIAHQDFCQLLQESSAVTIAPSDFAGKRLASMLRALLRWFLLNEIKPGQIGLHELILFMNMPEELAIHLDKVNCLALSVDKSDKDMDKKIEG